MLELIKNLFTKTYKEGRDFVVITDEGLCGEQHLVRILRGRYAGLVYGYGAVQIAEVYSGRPIVKYNYEIVKEHSKGMKPKAFKEAAEAHAKFARVGGDILIELCCEGESENVIVEEDEKYL